MSEEHLTNQDKLEEIYHMTLENHEILRSIRRQQHVANAFRFLYWVVILGALGGAYYYIRPVISTFTNNRDKIDSTFKQFEQLRSQFPDAKLLNQILHGQGASSTSAPQEGLDQ